MVICMYVRQEVVQSKIVVSDEMKEKEPIPGSEKEKKKKKKNFRK